MSKALKAALLSGLVFPGIGHFVVKKPLKAALVMGVSIVCVYVMVAAAVDVAQELSLKIQTGEIPLDINSISQAVSEQQSQGRSVSGRWPPLLLLIAWLFGIIDSYREGRVLDKAAPYKKDTTRPRGPSNWPE